MTLTEQHKKDRKLIPRLLAHLYYCGWGDKWEQEISEDLRKEAWQWEKENPNDE